jgi:hypothetical protein
MPPIYIRDNVHGGRGGDREPNVHNATDVSKNPFHRGPVSISRRMHVEADLLHGVLQLRASESQVLQTTNNGVIVRHIRSRRSSGSGELGVRVDRSGRRRAVKHPSTL